MLDLKCRECGQSFKTPAELEEHAERLHQIKKKSGAEVAPDPPNDGRRSYGSRGSGGVVTGTVGTQ